MQLDMEAGGEEGLLSLFDRFLPGKSGSPKLGLKRVQLAADIANL